MKSVLCFAIIVCVAHCIDNHLVTRSRTLPDGEGRLGIYDGKPISIEEAPYTVAIKRLGITFCAGAILSNKWIVTSGHCGYQRNSSDLTVVAGSNDGESGQTYEVAKIVVHPKFDPTQYDYDLALVKIVGECKWSSKVKPINLPSKSPAPNTKVVASGYGATKLDEFDEANGHLMAGDMYWQTENYCKQAYSKFSLKWTPRMACAYNQGKTTLCAGDWADPLVYNNTLLGLFNAVASEGFCTSRAKPCIMTNVCSLSKWIKKVIKA